MNINFIDICYMYPVYLFDINLVGEEIIDYYKVWYCLEIKACFYKYRYKCSIVFQ